MRVGVSGGVALYPAHGTDFEELLRRADAALYASKRSGRNCFHLYTSAGAPPLFLISKGMLPSSVARPAPAPS